MPNVRLEHGWINYHDQGHGQPIVFLHGALANGQTWRKVPPLMPPEYRCIVPDARIEGGQRSMRADAADNAKNLQPRT